MPSLNPARFTTTTTIEPDACVLAIAGEVDLDTADDFERALERSRDHDLPVAVDLTGCLFMDSTGLQCLLHHRDAAVAQGQRIVLVWLPSGPIARLFDLVAPGLFEVSETLDGARALLAPADDGGAQTA